MDFFAKPLKLTSDFTGNTMKALTITIASGKGGTGKTTFATNLASVIGKDRAVSLLDCDAEEPNCHLFLNPHIVSAEEVTIPIPEVLPEKCTACGICDEVCEYHAIIVIKDQVLVFPELCHSCGACLRFCPEGAIIERGKTIGRIERGNAAGIRFVHGFLNIGEIMTPAVIRRVQKEERDADIRIIDAPPGTSCPVIEAVKDADFVLLVTEPTPFGLYDLKLAVDMVRQIGIPCAVAINRSTIGDDRVNAYCRQEDIPVLVEIPDDRKIAEAYSRGRLISEADREYENLFRNLWKSITGLVEKKRTDGSITENKRRS